MHMVDHTWRIDPVILGIKNSITIFLKTKLFESSKLLSRDKKPDMILQFRNVFETCTINLELQMCGHGHGMGREEGARSG